MEPEVSMMKMMYSLSTGMPPINWFFRWLLTPSSRFSSSLSCCRAMASSCSMMLFEFLVVSRLS